MYLNDCEGLNLACSCAIRKLLNNTEHGSMHLKESTRFPPSIKVITKELKVVTFIFVYDVETLLKGYASVISAIVTTIADVVMLKTMSLIYL
ncbi:hypothetical protein RO3G_02542 [Rhizopus delemar RA 99-880]|uniref:Uncharacterized protein n=1 Tax=Rhizopus delemar (strain RA 99-880 / ATCC MYA-4621 / FGSC 9543 / NRRL 43880) TaxID=246409 RepID=I1BNQ8_RHIO9|nr:hypothetical protein RO3G_02542 [Rhizopus delemar RA 99-880]|eukprot:EIE77838.1 hypothetical protein RO3G_02542 [Rhizopus delemar RA 99-880]